VNRCLFAPANDRRYEVPRAFIEAADEFVFNFDEIGLSQSGHRCEGRVIIPPAMTWQTIFHGVHGSSLLH
jgi:hypothetical protein